MKEKLELPSSEVLDNIKNRKIKFFVFPVIILVLLFVVAVPVVVFLLGTKFVLSPSTVITIKIELSVLIFAALVIAMAIIETFAGFMLARLIRIFKKYKM